MNIAELAKRIKRGEKWMVAEKAEHHYGYGIVDREGKLQANTFSAYDGASDEARMFNEHWTKSDRAPYRVVELCWREVTE